MNSFFQNHCGLIDCKYCNVKSDTEMREFIEGLWRNFWDLAESNFLTEATKNFHACFWEMYVGVALRRHGLNPKRVSTTGPDFLVCIDGLRIWIEATTAEAGDGDDAVPPIPSSCEDQADCPVPDDKITLRITNAIAKKRKQFQKAIDHQVAKDSDALIVAINGNRIRNGSTLSNASEVLPKALLGEGDLGGAVDPSTGDIVLVKHAFIPKIEKANKKPVSTVGFSNGDYPDISGAIYSEAHVGNVCNLETTDPKDWHLLHNPGAEVPIPPGLLPVVSER